MAEKYKDVRYRNATSEGKKLIKLYDGDGLFLWVYEDGKKYWRLRYRLHGKEKLLSLGVYPDVSLSLAREKAKIERDKIKNNIDPSIDRQINKQKAKEAASNSFKAVADEWHAKQHTWTKTHSKS
ncbi:MAG: Arm DNA-binding domain-containing protein, partial [Nitrosomonas sp.]